MTVNSENLPVAIERSKPKNPSPITGKDLAAFNEPMVGKQDMVSLATYLRDNAGKSRGIKGGKEDLNSHFEEFIVKEDGEIKVVSLVDFQEQLVAAGVTMEILGVESIGNAANQRVFAVVQGVNRDNPQSGYERPVVAEGPHLILAPYALEADGDLHVFRTIQYRTGEAVVDTPRGFTPSKKDEKGVQMYDLDEARGNVGENLTKVIGEEAGKRLLQIKRVVYLGAHRVNSSFVTSKSAIFGVEVDYDNFIKSSKVITEEELVRRREQLEHEGLTGAVLDMNVSDYLNYKSDSDISKDMAADWGTDAVVLAFLATKLEVATQVLSERRRMSDRLVDILKHLKARNPRAYEKTLRKFSADLVGGEPFEG